jgi:Cytochrome c7 and related cytochrome c
MPQVFPRSANTLSKVSIFGSLFLVPVLIWACMVFVRSSYGTGAGVARVQPVPFSHEHHVGILGIDCRYCHTSVEHSSFAGIPPTKTCMNCHSQIWVGSDMLEPVRESYRTGQSLRWARVYNVPGFVYFDHSIHIHKGIGCASCHGRIDDMPFTYQAPSLLMEWCLDCHRHPENHLRPRAQVFNMRWQPSDEKDEKGNPYDQLRLGRKLVDEYKIRDASIITSCSICHR